MERTRCVPSCHECIVLLGRKLSNNIMTESTSHLGGKECNSLSVCNTELTLAMPLAKTQKLSEVHQVRREDCKRRSRMCKGPVTRASSIWLRLWKTVARYQKREISPRERQQPSPKMLSWKTRL